MANPYLKALKNRLDNGEISEELYNQLAELLKEPEEEPIEIIPAPTLEERLAIAENTILGLMDILMMGGGM